jgi:hypothetical protein
MLVREFSRELRQVFSAPALWPEKGALLATEAIVLAAALGITILGAARLLRLRNSRLSALGRAPV